MENEISHSYIPRLVDDTLSKYLRVFGAVSVEGPKWCGKTWTSLHQAESSRFLDDDETFEAVSLDMDSALDDKHPELIDEWTRIPRIWDKVRRKCDELSSVGNYILTCSTKLNSEEQKIIYHSGAGRIGRLKMYPMSLYESGESSGLASLSAMLNGTQKAQKVETPHLEEIAYYIVRGGWPRNLEADKELVSLIPKNYIEAVLSKDMNDDKKRDERKMRMLLRSLARNESTVVSNQTILNDIETYSNESDLLKDRETLSDYLDVLGRLNILQYQDAYSENYRSSSRVGKASKRHFVDPSLTAAILNLTPEKIKNDPKTFGFLFESLVERDLRIYIEHLGGHLYHFRDNSTGIEVDSILEFAGAEYAAVEIKLGSHRIAEAKEGLLKFSEKTVKKPAFMCVITANSNFITYDPETNIYTLPITSLKP